MTKDFSREIKPVVPGLKKYRLAGVSFFSLNMLYVLIALWKLPPVAPDIKKIVYMGLFILISLLCLDYELISISIFLFKLGHFNLIYKLFLV